MQNGQPNDQSTQQMPQPPMNQYPNAVPLASLQSHPAVVDCPRCHKREMTTVHQQNGGYTHCMAFLACICCCLGCIPYMMSTFKNVQHKCGSCREKIALYHRRGSTEIQDGKSD